MTSPIVNVALPDWLAEAVTAAALKQGMAFEDALRLAAYEYAERHAREELARNPPPPPDEVPAVVRMANALLANAIDRGASEVRLVPLPGGALSVVVRTEDGRASEMQALPPHVRAPLFDRFAAMAAGGGDRGSAFPVRHGDRGDYAVLLSWDGDPRSEMVLRIAAEAAGA